LGERFGAKPLGPSRPVARRVRIVAYKEVRPVTHLAAVAGGHQQGSETVEVDFCSYCGKLGDGLRRVCDSCGLGVRLRTDARALDGDAERFLIVRRDGLISAASAAAERDLPHRGPLVGRPLLAVLSSLEGDLAGAVALAATGTSGVARMQVEPVDPRPRVSGSMYARIASCGQPPAALVVVHRVP
jgi:hypothetical protein